MSSFLVARTTLKCLRSIRAVCAWSILIAFFLFTGCGKQSQEVNPAPRLAVAEVSNASPIVQQHQPKISHEEAMAKFNEEIKQHAIDHYNSAEEVAYRKEIETSEHFHHLRMMNEIENGSGDVEPIKLKHQIEIEGMKNRHEMREIEYEKGESKWREDWIKAHD